MKSIIYQSIIKFLNFMPFRNILAHFLRKMKFLPIDKFYRDFKILGKFQVEIDSSLCFKMIGYGGGIENETFWKGLFKSWESDTGWIFKDLVRNEGVIIDIGANVGIYSLVAKAINPNSIVYAFEPSNSTYPKLVRNNEINNFDIICKKIAFSSSNGKAVFYDVPGPNQTSASLSNLKLKNWAGYDGEIVEYEVDVNTFDSFVENNDIQQVDLVKIDVEMHEPEVLAGMVASIDRFKPTIIIEVLSDEIGKQIASRFDDSWNFFFLDKGEKLVKVDRLKYFKHQYPYYFNYLIIHNDKIDDVKKYMA